MWCMIFLIRCIIRFNFADTTNLKIQGPLPGTFDTISIVDKHYFTLSHFQDVHRTRIIK